MESVTFNETAEQENISLEQQAVMQNELQEEQQQGETPNVDGDRPEWLPEKFENPEALADAYSNLEKQFHGSKSDSTTAEPETSDEVTPEAGNSPISSASEEYYANGELSEESYQALEQSGIPKDMVDRYIQGHEAVSEREKNSLMNEAGGAEGYEAMSEWAATSLTDQEQEVYNNTIESGDINAATMAIRGLYARYQSDGGQPVNLVQGETSGTSAGVPFGSSYEMTQAMRDPRYKNDDGFRKQVEQRIASTTAF